MSDWSNQLKTIAAKGEEDLGELCRAVKIELFSGTVSDTRVRTGRLRGNWQIQEDSPPNGELDRLDKDGSKVNAEIEGGSSEGGVTYFVNNLPYAGVWEERDGMVARNVARVDQVLRKKAGEL